MIKFGEMLPLTLQVFDGREDLRVEARLFLENGEGYQTAQLASVTGGLYQNVITPMPKTNWVTCVYVVFDGTTESQDYQRTAETFLLDRSDETVQAITENLTPEKASFVVGEEQETTSDDPFIEGKIE